MAEDVERLKSLVGKARKVRSGDVILPDDVNVLVDVVVGMVSVLDKIYGIAVSPVDVRVTEQLYPVYVRTLPEGLPKERAVAAEVELGIPYDVYVSEQRYLIYVRVLEPGTPLERAIAVDVEACTPLAAAVVVDVYNWPS